MFQVMSKRLCPWHLQNVMFPWHFRMSCALALKSVHSGAYPMSKVHTDAHPRTKVQTDAHPRTKVHTDAHPMSKVHTFADLLQLGCLGSPLSIRGAVLPMLMSSITESWPQAICHTGLLKTQHTWCPPLVYGQSPPSSMVGLHSLRDAQSL